MRKLSKTRFSSREEPALDPDRLDHWPGRIPGATITSWHGSPEIDLDALFDRAPSGGHRHRRGVPPAGSFPPKYGYAIGRNQDYFRPVNLVHIRIYDRPSKIEFHPM
ncbi:MAG TPA: hypothetical protein VGH29_19525 [Candidatus Binataceae bacterium]